MQQESGLTQISHPRAPLYEDVTVSGFAGARERQGWREAKWTWMSVYGPRKATHCRGPCTDTKGG
jgi:hypothetical protein